MSLRDYSKCIGCQKPLQYPEGPYCIDCTNEALADMEINDIVHEGRAKKRGLTWNRKKKRYELAGLPGFFKADGSFYAVSESEWEAHHKKVAEWENKP